MIDNAANSFLFADLYNATELRDIAINHCIAHSRVITVSDVIQSIRKLQSNTFEEIMNILLMKL